MCGWSAWAQNVTEQQALATAQQFLQGKTFETTASPRRAAGTADAVAECGIYIVCPDGNRQGSNARRVIVKQEQITHSIVSKDIVIFTL